MAVRGKHGAMLAGRYRLLEQLGEGGMGSVWKAEHLLLHSQVAIKIIDPEVARLEFNLARFLREAKTLATLRSPNVVQVLDFGSDADTPYLVMELLQGQTLGRRLTEQGRLSLSETSRVMNDVCTAMSLVHEQGLIHRDLKPENIFLCDNGDHRVTKVVDFGIAKSLRGDMSASMKTRTGHMLGTPSYMSPEQCRGLKDIDHRADLWALGVITYECLVGKVPFEGEVLGDLLLRICMDPLPIPSRNVKGPLPGSFDAWFAKAVARDRAERYQSAAELAMSLAELSTTLGLGVTLSARDGAARDGAARDGAARDGAARDGAARDGAARDGLEPSRPSLPRLSPLPSGTPRQPSNTETNTTIGLVGAAFKVDRRARTLAMAAVALSAGLGLWALGNKRAAGDAEGVDVRRLRPPYAVTPKTIRTGVPSGRRWPVTSGHERSARDHTGGQLAPRDALAGTGAASAASAGSVAANVAPGIHIPSSASGGAGSSPSVTSARDGSPGNGSSASGSSTGAVTVGGSGARPPGAAPPGASGQRGSAGTQPAPGAPSPPGANPAGSSSMQTRPSGTPAATPPRALRGTAAPAPNRDREDQPSETSIRRSR